MDSDNLFFLSVIFDEVKMTSEKLIEVCTRCEDCCECGDEIEKECKRYQGIHRCKPYQWDFELSWLTFIQPKKGANEVDRVMSIVCDGVTYMFPVPDDISDKDVKEDDLVIYVDDEGEYNVGRISGAIMYVADAKKYLKNYRTNISDSHIEAVYKCTLWEKDKG